MLDPPPKVVGFFAMRNNLRFGVGINDGENNSDSTAYLFWQNILIRCYCKPRLEKFSTYKECSVCEEWKNFSSFKRWFDENYIAGYELDKDIIVKGNKTYGPDKCCFVPSRINTLLINSRKSRGILPVGVSFHKGHKKFQATIHKDGKTKHIGYFNSPEEAFRAYKFEKESYIKKLAQEYHDAGLITNRVYDALTKHEIEITD